MTRKSFVLAALSLALLPTMALAQKAPAQKLPTATKIFDRYLQVTGGKANYAKIKTIEQNATMDLSAQKIKGTVTVHMDLSGRKMRMVQNISGIGETVVVINGKAGWSKDAINGLRPLGANELSQTGEQLDLDPTSVLKRYAKVEVIGVRKVNGADAYAVKLTPKKGDPQTQYFEVKTGLLCRADITADTPQGKIPMETYMSDYRSVGGVKFPFKSRQVVPGAVEIEISYTDIKVNVPLDAKLFAKPTE